MQKVRYEIDPYNRLVVSGAAAEGGIPAFRQALEGRLKIDENNNLSYNIKAPLSEKYHIPNQIRLKGEWSLGGNHDLRLTLDKSARKTFGDRITLQGEILDVNANSLLFAITTVSKEDTRSTYVLNLSGSWKADEDNRLSFHVRKEKGKHDILIFTGAWQINRNNQIIYQYENTELIRKKRETHALTFKGYWDIRQKARISYVLSKDTDSAFDFSVGAGIFKDGYIKYELGIGLRKTPDRESETITLSGRWMMKKDMGLIFEMEYGKRKTHAIVFGADAKLTDNDTVIFRLKNNTDNKDLGVSLELSHKMLKGDAELFMRALKSKQESAIYAGAAWRW